MLKPPYNALRISGKSPGHGLSARIHPGPVYNISGGPASCAARAVEARGVEGNVLINKAGDKKVTVIVAVLHADRRAVITLGAGRLQQGRRNCSSRN